MARLIGRVPARQIRPWRTGAKDPEHPIEHIAWITPGPPTKPRSSLLATGHEPLDRLPLVLGQVRHRPRYKHGRRRMEIAAEKWSRVDQLAARRVVRCVLIQLAG